MLHLPPMTRAWRVEFAVWLLVLGAGTAYFYLSDADLAWTAPWYTPVGGWQGEHQWFWQGLYQYGEKACNLPGLLAVGALLGSLRWRALVPYRGLCLLVIFVWAVAVGLLVNVAFKGHWGRPRPSSIQQYDGKETFLRVGVLGHNPDARSFPSGHAAIGAFLVTPWFYYRRRARGPAAAWLALGVAGWLLLGVARVLQGGHFPSDVLWSGGLVYLTALVGVWLLRLEAAGRAGTPTTLSAA